MGSPDPAPLQAAGEPKPVVPSISLPKGGGAIRGMGEKFAANPVTGTGSMSVPIATSPGRSGFGPQLFLSYDSGAGNGPFGFGWSLSLPAITRKTDKGLPQYLDGIDSDVFILSGSEDLVPVYRQDPNGTWVRDASSRLVIHEDDIDGYRVRRYRPRIEGLFARIERWSRIGSPGDVHWRSISKDNILTLYGHDANSRIADPLDADRIFSWLICESRDDKGNAIRYLYKKEDGEYQLRPNQDDPFRQAHQRNRGPASDPRRTSQRYLHRVLYGNREPLLDAKGQRPRFLSGLPNPPADTSDDWLFEVRLDYGELDKDNPGTQERPWIYRPDAFSTCRAGFEVRTCRRCARVLMLHHIPDQSAGPGRAAQHGYQGVVRSTEFTYDDEPGLPSKPVYSFLKQVTQTGWKLDQGTYTKRSLPPLVFEYSQPVVQETLEEVDPESLENLPIGLDGSVYRWVDLHGEGTPGILTEQAGAWHYKRNWSPLTNAADFAPLETVSLKPNAALANGAEFMDLAGDGLPDVVVMGGYTPGLYEHDEAEGWQPFRPLTSRLNRDLRDPNLKFVDLDGDGHSDVLITEGDALVWHPSLAEEGFGPAHRVVQALDEEQGPRIVFADGTESIHLADLSGDGLTDLCRIRNGEVCYWPNLGHGRFGAKVTMDDAPWFDNPDQFDPKRIRLADIDGSGTTDIIYLHRDGVCLYFNQSGNGWSQPQKLKVFPSVDNLVSIIPLDLLGNGTACLVWSSSLPGDTRRPMRYVNLMGVQKPHLLVRTINNLGAETRVDYAPSTRFYLKDKQQGKPWITRLPFPVHVVERVEMIDHISRNRFVTRYAYHHGYFDGEEREFRGFGMVEQWDTERLDAVAKESDADAGYLNEEAAFTQPPVHTKTWIHTGVCLGRERVSRHYASEYFREPNLSPPQAEAQLLPDTMLPAGLTLAEEREACRALKGMMLRQEVYADDADHPGATPEQIQRACTPYTVTEQNFAIRMLQPKGANRHGGFFSHPNEALTYHYERNPADPRIQHALTLEVDDFGNVLKQAAIGYGRRCSLLPEAWDQERQTTTLLTYTENCFTNAIDTTDQHRTPLPCEAITCELTGYPATGPAGRYQPSDFVEPDPNATGRLRHRFTAPEVPYESIASGSRRRRPIERVRTLYRPDDQGASAGNINRLLGLGKLEALALPGESYKLAFTPGLLDAVFQRQRAGQSSEELLPFAERAQILGGRGGDQGGYVDLDGDGRWWIPSGRSFFSADPAHAPATELAEARQHFFLPRRYRDPFGQHAFVDHDGHDLLMRETRDALDNCVTVESNDYRVLQPRLVSDPNRNRSEVAFDALGMVVGTAVMGKPSPATVEGDSLAGFEADPSPSQIDDFLAEPVEAAADPKRTQATALTRTLLADATTRIVYDLDRFHCTQKANPEDPAKWLPAMAATIARETHVSDLADGQESRLQVGFSYSDGFGREIQKKIQAEPGPLDASDPQAPDVNPRWVGSGWTVFNNKGKPVRQFEPFFSGTHHFEFGVIKGVSPVLFYDPVDRVVATLHPNHTWEKVVFDPWQQTTWDVNDTVASFDLQSGAASVRDPASDPDAGGFFRRLPSDAYLPTWYDLRTDDAKALLGWPDQDAKGNPLPDNAKRRASEKTAAARAAAHADTPTAAHFDALGRTFLTVARNRVICPNHDLDGTEERVATRVELDIEGNQRAVRDAIRQAGDPLGRIVMRYAYDMLGNRIHQASMEAGERWMLNDTAGKPLLAWDSRGHRFRTRYDSLRRPTGSCLQKGPGPEVVIGRTVYGESQADAERNNLRGKVYQAFDQAGVVTTAQYDFKGHALSGERQLAVEYKTTLDWSGNVPLEAEIFRNRTTYDALNRPVALTTQDGSVVRPSYNEANLLERIEANLRGSSKVTPFVSNIDYDAKGQRVRAEYGNGARTAYEYDPLTFRLVSLLTTRGSDVPRPGPCGLQNLHYTYDPAGNITHIRDDAQQAIFFANKRVDPSSDYVYDALYRLIEAHGREHLGQTGGELNAPAPPDAFDELRSHLPHPGNGDLMGTYIERYVYDAVGNFLSMQHRGGDATNGGWNRTYAYSEPSQVEPGKRNNRLTRTTIGQTTEAYGYAGEEGLHGNITSMPHLPLMRWDHHDQLRATARQVVKEGGTPETTWYVYDGSGQRVRKITENASGTRTRERIYLGGFETYREYDGRGKTLDRETLHVMDDKHRVALVETKTYETGLLNAMRGWLGSPETLVRYQFGNHLSSASLELDEQAQVISYEEYAPYGSTTYQAVRCQTETGKRYRYTGKERDEESGLYYHGARYYAVSLGRWTSCDPGGLIDGPNLYTYAADSPVVLTDPSGHQSAAPGPPGTQICFYEYKAFFQRVTATATGRGFTSQVYADALKVYQSWGGQGTPDLAHVEKPFALTRPGETTNVAPQAPSINRSYAATEKVLVAEARARGEVTRVNDYYPGAVKGTRYGQPEQSDFFKSESFRNMRTSPAAPSNSPAVPATPKATGSAPEQLSLPFDRPPTPKPGPEPTVSKTVAAHGSSAPSTESVPLQTSGPRTAMRAGGAMVAVAGTAYAAYAFGEDVSQGRFDSAAMNGTAFVGGGLALGGSLAGSTTLVTAGTLIGAPAAVAGAGLAGWTLGEYTNENTAISDVAGAVGSAVERLTGSSTLGAVGAAVAAVDTAPVFVPIAVAKGIGSGAAWVWNKIF